MKTKVPFKAMKLAMRVISNCRIHCTDIVNERCLHVMTTQRSGRVMSNVSCVSYLINFETSYSRQATREEVLRDIPHKIEAQAVVVLPVGPRSVFNTFILIQYSLVMCMFCAICSEVLKTSLNKAIINISFAELQTVHKPGTAGLW
jgi:hypothetical protein